MRITVFTSNQPRHVALIESLASIADEVFAVQESNTVFPGRVADFFKKSDVMREYFARVMDAEQNVFGSVRFPPANARTLPVKMGDLNSIPLEAIELALHSDAYVVFGASYIKGPLVDFLVARRAYNIHMGVSPYYRGSSTNFWSLYDRRPQYVGATIHLLTKGLDSGPMLFHALPEAQDVDPFLLGMLAVKAGHDGLKAGLTDGSLARMDGIAQDKSRELRYTRNSDFTDEVAAEYLGRLQSPAEIGEALRGRKSDDFVRAGESSASLR